MNLIEALKKADGKPVTRPVTGHAVFVFDKNELLSTGEGETPHIFSPCMSGLLADDWYVVEKKSPIEEAIERMLPGNTPIDRIEKSQLRRLVNLTLDEAIRVVTINNPNCDHIIEEVRALKVKL